MICKINQLILIVNLIVVGVPIKHFVFAPLECLIVEAVFYILVFNDPGLMKIYYLPRIKDTFKLCAETTYKNCDMRRNFS